MRLQLRSSLVKPAKKVIGKQRLTVLVNVSFPAPSFKMKPRTRGFVVSARCAGKIAGVSWFTSSGRVAEWLCSGLQIRVRRFNSDLGLQLDLPGHPGKSLEPRYGGVFCYGDVTRLPTGYRQITQFWR